jgi:transglutaminase-like putative cysteine protease
MDPTESIRGLPKEGSLAAFRGLESRERSGAALLARQGGAASSGEDRSAAVSPWLYIAGLCVTLSGLYAVNFGREDPGFAATTYAVAIIGYASSYFVRRLQVGYESFRLPLLVLVGLGLFAWLSTGPAGSAGDAPAVLADRSHAMQVLCVWVALLQPFAAMSDMAVLSSCVPCMSLIALVSTTSPDTEIQYSFLVFIAAATFLMVHENYLRTRVLTTAASPPGSDRKLFTGQLQLAVGCVACAFLLANIVAVPMHAFGKSLSLSGAFAQPSSFTGRASSALSDLLSNDSQTLAIGIGPVTESDVPVMRVEAPRTLNWRGSTYDYYSGRSFENSMKGTTRLGPADEANDLKSLQGFHNVDEPDKSVELAAIGIPVSPVEPWEPTATSGATRIEQTVTVLLGGSRECYAAGAPRAVSVPRDQALVSTPAGGIFASTPFAPDSKYRVKSVIPTEDESLIRSAAARSPDLPGPIAYRYLQRAPSGRGESAKLRRLADQITSGIKNDYDKAVAIKTYIAQNCKYNLQAPAAPAESDRVEYFLTASHQGYCDSFAAAMTMLCRYASLPARVASGYISGQPDGKGDFLVRQKDKHAWTEVYFQGVGWIPFDATDGSEDISDHTQRQTVQRPNFVGWLFSHGLLPPLLVACLAGLLAYLAWTELLPRLARSRRSGVTDGAAAANQEIVSAYLDACRLLERRGLRRPRSSTPAEFLAEARPSLAATSAPAAEALTVLTALHDRFRYGRETAAESDVKAAQEAVAAVRTGLARVSARTLASMHAAPQTT